jgi:hypothetical protein
MLPLDQVWSCSSNVPDGHVWARNLGKADGSGETLVALRIIILKADLQFDGLEEVSLLGLKRVLEEFLDVGTHSGWWGKCVSCALLATAGR